MLWFHDSFSSLSLLYSYALSFTSRHSFYPPRLYEFDDHQHFIQRYDISAVFILSSSSILGRHWFLTRLNALVGLVQLCRHDFCLLNPAINLRSNITQATYDFVTQFPILLSSPISLFPPFFVSYTIQRIFSAFREISFDCSFLYFLLYFQGSRTYTKHEGGFFHHDTQWANAPFS